MTIMIQLLAFQAPLIMIDPKGLGFVIPDLGTVLTFLVKAFFIIAGLLALFYLLLGAVAWITSGGNKESVDKARNKIQAAVIGVILVVVVLSIVITLEQVVFRRALCFGISCGITIPALLQPSSPTASDSAETSDSTPTPSPISDAGDAAYHTYDTPAPGATDLQDSTNPNVNPTSSTPTPRLSLTPTVGAPNSGGALDFLFGPTITPSPTPSPTPKK